MLAARSDYPPAHRTEPVDRQHLARYTLGDIGLENEVLELFASQLPSLIEGLKDAPTARERYVAAHTLKGSSRAIGAWKLAALAEDAERCTAHGEGTIAAEILRRIEEHAAELIAYVAHGMLVT